mmetsp:Transcript_40852/g.68280  ORF Transcript_40852/g.68280 Transcript_40852/m.68280 type:complete len:85 (+) Transcript_40852:145-399(+)
MKQPFQNIHHSYYIQATWRGTGLSLATPATPVVLACLRRIVTTEAMTTAATTKAATEATTTAVLMSLFVVPVSEMAESRCTPSV